MLKRFFSILVLSVALMALAMLVARPAVAAPASVTFTVNSTLDVPDDSPSDGNCHTALLSPAAGACTLRAAVMSADMASGAGATIIVPAGIYSLTIPADVTDTANTGDLNLTTPTKSGDQVIRIFGAGASGTIIDANQSDRVLTVNAGRTAAISGLTLRGGSVSGGFGGGGGILNNGTLTLDNSTVNGNQAVTGGGLMNSYYLTVTNSAIGPNNTATLGGGIDNLATLTVDRSTIYTNSADYGGGIYNGSSYTLTLVNSTLSQNSAVTDGGGLYNVGTANAFNTTILSNLADTATVTSSAAGGIYSDNSGTVNLLNTLLAGNSASNALTAADCTGTVHSYGRNLFGEPIPCTVSTETGTFSTINSIDLIGPLQNNGGPTWTHALLTGSNAIDGGDPDLGCVGPGGVLLNTDQRGFARVVGPSCDIGAFEYRLPVYLPTILR